MAKLESISQEDLAGLTPEEVVNALNTGVQILNATEPFIKELFDKIGEFFSSIKFDSLAFPHGKRIAIEYLQQQNQIAVAKDAVQKELNKIITTSLLQLQSNEAKIVSRFEVIEARLNIEVPKEQMIVPISAELLLVDTNQS